MQMLQKNPEPAKWVEPVETIYQSLGGGKGTELTPKLPHLSEADALFLGHWCERQERVGHME